MHGLWEKDLRCMEEVKEHMARERHAQSQASIAINKWIKDHPGATADETRAIVHQEMEKARKREGC